MTGYKCSKHARIYEHIRGKISRGEYQAGFQIPTEAAISQQFRISRQTVGRVLRALEMEGLVSRRRGAGTFVTGTTAVPAAKTGHAIAALIPDADDGVFFSRVCMQMSFAARKRGVGLFLSEASYGHKDLGDCEPGAFCRELIEARPAGVIFCPFKLPSPLSELNTRIVETLERAGIAVVLLDCDICDYPLRSRFDVVCIDNRRGGYLLASHLWNLGCHRIEFVAPYWNRPTVAARIAGYQEFLTGQGVRVDPDWVHHGDLAQPAFIAGVLDRMRNCEVDAFMCANDWTAAVLMRSLISSGVRVPQDVRVVGFDGINITDVLPIALTTYTQPVEELGHTVVEAMLERLENPGRPARRIVLEGRLDVRESCGARR